MKAVFRGGHHQNDLKEDIFRKHLKGKKIISNSLKVNKSSGSKNNPLPFLLFLRQAFGVHSTVSNKSPSESSDNKPIYRMFEQETVATREAEH